ncbi:MAG: hypothetical protein IJU21_04725 [Bacteroidales bacterium]|nr:hypothetical protein [Bacteroidales bacterium]
MKKLLISAGVVLALLMTGCEMVQEYEDRLSAVESKLESLQKQVDEMNSQIGLIRQLLSGKYLVQSVSDLEDGSGYSLVLVDSDGKTVEKTVRNGSDARSPQISVKQDTDGLYYWTVDGNWLMADGKKVSANGKDGLTPEIHVVDGKWYYRLGDGEWIYAGDAVTTAVGPIAGIDTTTKEGVVIFTLSDGTTFEVPFAGTGTVKLQILVDDTAFRSLEEGQAASALYEVKAPANLTYTLDSYEPQGWTVTFSGHKDNKGTLIVKRPENSSPAKVLLIATGDDGSCFVKVLHVGFADDADDTVYEAETVTSAGGSIALPAGASSVVIPSGSQSWVSLQGGQLVLQENTTYDSRSATITYKQDGKDHCLTITQAQKDAIVLSASSLEADAAGGSLEFVLSANVTVSAQANQDWLQVNPPTKGLVEKVFTITYEANATGVARFGQVTFSYDTISQTVTVEQASQGGGLPVSEDFVLLEDASDLAEGDQLLIVSLDGEYVMGPQTGTGNKTYRTRVSVTVKDGVISEVPAGAAIVTLEGEEGEWKLAVEGGYLSALSSGNYLKTVTSTDQFSTWSISLSSDFVATVLASAGASPMLCHNGASNGQRFSCYKVDTSVDKVNIYRRSTGVPSYVTQYSDPGVYLGSNTRIYTPGTDQYVRLYQENTLDFIILDPDSKEQLVLSGIDTASQEGQQLTVGVEWKKAGKSVLSKQYSMALLKDTDDMMWIGDSKGKGFIVKK